MIIQDNLRSILAPERVGYTLIKELYNYLTRKKEPEKIYNTELERRLLNNPVPLGNIQRLMKRVQSFRHHPNKLPYDKYLHLLK